MKRVEGIGGVRFLNFYSLIDAKKQPKLFDPLTRKFDLCIIMELQQCDVPKPRKVNSIAHEHPVVWLEIQEN